MLTAQSLELLRILCLPLSLPLPRSCSTCLSLKSKMLKRERERERESKFCCPQGLLQESDHHEADGSRVAASLPPPPQPFPPHIYTVSSLQSESFLYSVPTQTGAHKGQGCLHMFLNFPQTESHCTSLSAILFPQSTFHSGHRLTESLNQTLLC